LQPLTDTCGPTKTSSVVAPIRCAWYALTECSRVGDKPSNVFVIATAAAC
jgi:hypothetical protein